VQGSVDWMKELGSEKPGEDGKKLNNIDSQFKNEQTYMDNEREKDKEAFKIVQVKKKKEKKMIGYLQPKSYWEDPKDNIKQLVSTTYQHWYKQEAKGMGKRTLLLHEFNKMKIDDYVPSEKFHKYLEPTVSMTRKRQKKLVIDKSKDYQYKPRRATSSHSFTTYVPLHVKYEETRKQKYKLRPKSTDYFMKPYSNQQKRFRDKRNLHKKICKKVLRSPKMGGGSGLDEFGSGRKKTRSPWMNATIDPKIKMLSKKYGRRQSTSSRIYSHGRPQYAGMGGSALANPINMESLRRPNRFAREQDSGMLSEGKLSFQQLSKRSSYSTNYEEQMQGF
jgi:hypothetical protein